MDEELKDLKRQVEAFKNSAKLEEEKGDPIKAEERRQQAIATENRIKQQFPSES